MHVKKFMCFDMHSIIIIYLATVPTAMIQYV
jgi:hypothetical protein